MIEIDLLNELYLVIKAKREALKTQRYEEAVDYRDRERELQNKLVDIIKVVDTSLNIENYFIQKYNVNYDSLFDENNFMQFMRELKLKNLGI